VYAAESDASARRAAQRIERARRDVEEARQHERSLIQLAEANERKRTIRAPPPLPGSIRPGSSDGTLQRFRRPTCSSLLLHGESVHHRSAPALVARPPTLHYRPAPVQTSVQSGASPANTSAPWACSSPHDAAGAVTSGGGWLLIAGTDGDVVGARRVVPHPQPPPRSVPSPARPPPTRPCAPREVVLDVRAVPRQQHGWSRRALCARPHERRARYQARAD
jgi:hypothetical protein